MELDPVARRARWAGAGHLPGVIASAGEGAWLGLADGPPLGVMSRRTWPGAERELAPGTRIVLFTDGLVESRVAPIDEGIDRIVAAATTAASLESLCDAALAQAPAPRIDDLALIALDLE
jgi:serine phosphatase RsbU (regulator of sigma subunit)